MKAEQRKEIETNSLVLAVQRWRQRFTGRSAYYLIGTIALIVGGILLYNYFAGERRKTHDAALFDLAFADTPEKLKAGMEAHRGTFLGSLFKLHLARHQLRNEGLPRLGTDNETNLKQAANSVEEARKYYLELTSELKEKEEPAMVQDAWESAGDAEQALVGLPKAESESDFRGNADKAIEYFDKAASIFPDSEPSKRNKAKADKIRANKEQFIADQKALYRKKPSPIGPPPLKDDPFNLGPMPKAGAPVEPKGPPISSLPPTPDAKGKTEPKAPEPPKPDPAKSPEPKSPEPPKGPDPKAK
ncbi:MAG TPA: hypothetical protein VKD71_06270 [Gemmataceae bacterium]|nr:hypothetical protein [Gemmataceae bacterium]